MDAMSNRASFPRTPRLRAAALSVTEVRNNLELNPAHKRSHVICFQWTWSNRSGWWLVKADESVPQGLLKVGNGFLQTLFEANLGLVAQHLAGAGKIGTAARGVVLRKWVVDDLQRLAEDLLDGFDQLQH